MNWTCDNCLSNPADVLVVLWGYDGGVWCDHCVLELGIPVELVVLAIPMVELGVR
jgi:hypothetical protein